MAKPKKKASAEGWIRLSNGVIEKEVNVGNALLALRYWAVNYPARFEQLAQFVAGTLTELPDPIVAELFRLKFTKSADGVELYDDVRDVIECCSDWHGRKVRFSSSELMHKDQTNIVPSEDD